MKERNFVLIDKAIEIAGIKFVDIFLNQTEEISKLDLDEFIDNKLGMFCKRLNIE